MCGIVGYYNDNTTKKDLSILKQVLIESRIRGMHASGLAWYDGHNIQSLIDTVPIDQLLSKFELKEALYNKSRISLIAHARYSTSNLRYNQPILGYNMAVAHNGVISQENPKHWETLYGYKCEGKNDSELLLRAIEKGDDPFKVFPNASIAMVVLNKYGSIIWSRNGKRPLWQGIIGKGTVIASTYDILYQAGVEDIHEVACVGDDLQRRYLSS